MVTVANECDDEESHQEDPAEGDHVHDDRDDHNSASDLENDWLGYTTVDWSLQQRLFFRSSYVMRPCHRLSAKFFHIGLRVSLFVHAHLILLIITVALHDGSASVLLRGIQEIFCSSEFFLRFCRISIASTPLDDTEFVLDFGCLFLCIILDKIGNHRRFVWRNQDLSCQAGEKKMEVSAFSSCVCGTFGRPRMRKPIRSPGVASSLIEVGEVSFHLQK